MTSQIDITLPIAGSPTTESVRRNFATAAQEISALQIQTTGAPFVPLGGGLLTGPLYLDRDPTDPRQAVTKAYVDAGGGGSGGGGGIPEAPATDILYGRRNGQWHQAATPQDITDALAGVLTPATETVAGVARIATTAEANAGTNDTAFITSLKLAGRLNAYSGLFVTTTGSSTIAGNLVLAPTEPNTTGGLWLRRPDAGGTIVIQGEQPGAMLYQIVLANSLNSFGINRLVGTSPGMAMTIEQGGSITFNPLPGTGVGGLSIIADGAGTGPTIITGAATAVNAAQDYFMIAARRAAGATPRDGGFILLFGPSHVGAANSVQIQPGSLATGRQTFSFNPDGTAVFPRLSLTGTGFPLNIQQGGIDCGGNIRAESVTLFGGGNAVLNVSNGGIFCISEIQASSIHLFGGGVTVLNVPQGGITIAELICHGNAAIGGNVRANQGLHVGTFANFDCNANPAQNNGYHCGVGGSAWAQVAAYNFADVSDARAKTAVADLPACLDLVATITPHRYRWREGDDTDRTHWGFIAQEVAAVMDRAGLDFGGHSIQHGWQLLSYDELVAMLWKATQELAARVEQLESSRG